MNFAELTRVTSSGEFLRIKGILTSHTHHFCGGEIQKFRWLGDPEVQRWEGISYAQEGNRSTAG
jgi:hypothetical protein